MIDRSKYIWKMVKPLIPIIFLALWAILFEEKIWPDWENQKPIKIFDKDGDFTKRKHLCPGRNTHPFES